MFKQIPDLELALRVAEGDHDVFRLIMCLVKGGPERRAIEAGQIDAVMDPATGKALLLPAAQAALNAAALKKGRPGPPRL